MIQFRNVLLSVLLQVFVCLIAFQAMADEKFKVVAYYPAWSYKKAEYNVEKIPANLLDFLIYAFAIPDEEGNCLPVSEEAEKINIPALKKLKHNNSNVKILVAIGGWGYSSNFPKIAKNKRLREKFASSVISYMEKNYFDGIDLDWEYPSEKEQDDFIALVKLIRNKLDELASTKKRIFYFTIATPAGPWHVERMRLDEVARYVDWINLMSYDYAGNWSKIASHNAPLFQSAEAPNSLCVHNTVEAYLKAGINPQKILLGLPFFGHGWIVSKYANNNGLFHKVISTMQGRGGRGTLDYREIVVYLKTATRYWDSSARVPWLYDQQSGIMISYDDPEAIQHKISYAMRQKLGGVMIWHIAADSESGDLIRAISYNIEKSK